MHQAAESESLRRSTLPTLKLGQFDGLSPLETSLAKFENCSDYYDWNARECLCHLQASLDGQAGQVLWTDGKLSLADEVIQLLRNRFGNQDQRERYRAELESIRCHDGATLQSIYNKLHRVMALAFP